MSKYKIENSIPVPSTNWNPNSTKGRPKGEVAIILDKMEIGDSVHLWDKSQQQLGRYLYANPDKKFTTRAEINGCRVWRIA